MAEGWRQVVIWVVNHSLLSAGGEQEEKLRRYTQRYQIENVFILGFKNYSEAAKCYSIADVFVLPSLGESFGLAVNEAMCFGLPVIVTDKVSSAYDLVIPGESGYIIPSNNIESLAQTLEGLLSDDKKLKRMGARSKELISSWNYQRDVSGIIDALDFIYKR